MRRSKFSENHIVNILKEAEGGVARVRLLSGVPREDPAPAGTLSKRRGSAPS
jgi:hypothetical protein